MIFGWICSTPQDGYNWKCGNETHRPYLYYLDWREVKYKDDYRADLTRIGALLEEEGHNIQEMLKLNNADEIRWYLDKCLDKVEELRVAYERIRLRDLGKEVWEAHRESGNP